MKSRAPKPPPGPPPPAPTPPTLVQLYHLSPEERQWAADLGNENSFSEARAAIERRFGIHLESDALYARFRIWQGTQFLYDVYNDLAEAGEEALRREQPHLSPEQRRDLLLRQLHARAHLREDPKPILAVFDREVALARLTCQEQAKRLAREKFEFDGAKAALHHSKEIHEVDRNPSLTQHEKIDTVRRLIFGVIPEEDPTPDLPETLELPLGLEPTAPATSPLAQNSTTSSLFDSPHESTPVSVVPSPHPMGRGPG